MQTLEPYTHALQVDGKNCKIFQKIDSEHGDKGDNRLIMSVRQAKAEITRGQSLLRVNKTESNGSSEKNVSLLNGTLYKNGHVPLETIGALCFWNTLCARGPACGLPKLRSLRSLPGTFQS